MLPQAVALRLAYYASEGPAVLAPRGWHCMLLSGSNGDVLLVTPQAHPVEDFFSSKPLLGPAEEYTVLDAGTSGRFEVAAIAARLFPRQKKFVTQVLAEGIEKPADMPSGPYPTDVLTHRTATSVRFTTPAHASGFGTAHTRLGPDSQPIDGIAVLTPKLADDGAATVFAVRLPPDLKDLEPTIFTLGPAP